MALSQGTTVAIAITLALVCIGRPCEGMFHPLLPSFNCKKIAFYKTHKTGSTTLGGVLFRVAVSANLSMYTTLRTHYVSLGYKENPRLLGRSDMVLRHIRFSEARDFHAATRSFYGRALGTADFGFLTILRHPVDRYISDFFYYVEPEARLAGRKLTLRLYAAKGEGANRMAAEFAIRDAEAAVAFTAAEIQTEGLFLPLEWLDYGLALLAAHCGWRLSAVMYLPANSNAAGSARYGNVTLHGRPTMEQLAEQDPTLLHRIAAVNGVDSILYGAAASQLMALLLQPRGPAAAAATSAVMAAAVRLTAARKRLDGECRSLQDGQQAGGGAAAPPPPRGNISADELAGLCAWYSLPDGVYEKMASPETGRVAMDMALPSPATPPPLWPVGHLLRLADEHLASYGDPSTPYYHSLLAVHVRPPTAAEAELVYGVAGGGDGTAGGGGGGGGGSGGDEPLAEAVRLWALHHAREGLHHLVFFVDGAIDSRKVQVVRQAAAAGLGHSGGAADVAASYTSFSILNCGGLGDGVAGGGGGDAGSGCAAATGFSDLVARSRWSAVLPGLLHFLYGTRGSLRSVLLSYEGLLQGAGAVCAPLVPWRTPPLGVTVGWSGGGGGSASSSDSDGFSGQHEVDGGGDGHDTVSEAAQTGIGGAAARGSLPSRRSAVAAVGESAVARAADPGGKNRVWGPERTLLIDLVSGVAAGVDSEVAGAGAAVGGAGEAAAADGDGGSWPPPRLRWRRRHRRLQAEVPKAVHRQQRRGLTAAATDTEGGGAVTANAAAASGSGGGGGSAACLRAPCTLSIQDSRRCVMIRGMPLLGRTQPYTSNGEALPEGKSSYRVPYHGPEQHRLEVAALGPPSAEEQQQGGLMAGSGAGEVFRCSRLPRPRLRVGWCD